MEWWFILLMLFFAVTFIEIRKETRLRQNRSSTLKAETRQPETNNVPTFRNDYGQLRTRLNSLNLRLRSEKTLNYIPEGNHTHATPGPYAQMQRRNETNREKILVQNWKKSIAGLARLADQNLGLARQRLAVEDFGGAIQLAATSIENVARALIHCYGGKPDVDRGQEEALRLLCRRFEGVEREKFEDAIINVAWIGDYAKNSTSTKELAETEAKRVLGIASETVNLLKRTLIDHYAAEISELGESCPKCCSFDIHTCCFDEHTVWFECRWCHRKWVENRARTG